MPLYGHAFTNTTGLGQPYNGNGKGSFEAGIYDFKDLPLEGATEYWDEEAYATYSYDNSTGMLISYDTVELALTKVDYIQQNKLGGAMWWEVSGDKTGGGSIITNVSLIFSSRPSHALTLPGCQRDGRRRRQRHRVQVQLGLRPRLSVRQPEERIRGITNHTSRASIASFAPKGSSGS
jgi:GH18 family chitinase